MNLPVHCKCGWTGWRRAEKVKARPCPECDGEVTRNRALKKSIDTKITIFGREIPAAEWTDDPVDDWMGATPIERHIAGTKAPVPRLPNPYYLRAVTGEVQIFRIPAHVKRRAGRKRRRR